MAGWILDLIRSGSYPALALLTLVESVFPPVPSELILPLAGYLARHGDLSGVHNRGIFHLVGRTRVCGICAWGGL